MEDYTHTRKKGEKPTHQTFLTGYSSESIKERRKKYVRDLRKKNLNPEYELRSLINDSYKRTRADTNKLYEEYKTYTPKSNGTKKNYPRDWSLYETASQEEKLVFYKILKEASEMISMHRAYEGNGRPPSDIKDIVKSLCIRAYHHTSSWRLESELKIARAMGIIDSIPKRSTLNKYLHDENITPILEELYETIALPVALVETSFSADASGIGCSYGTKHWSSVRHTKNEFKESREFVKLHVISGNKTNAITAALITTGHEHESPRLPELLEKMRGKYKIVDFCADAGYLSRTNVEAIVDMNAVPFIAGKKNSSIAKNGLRHPWNRMLYLWKNHQMFFAQHFHQRSNVESLFSQLKRLYVHTIRAKTFSSQVNETLCKIVCHNAHVLCHAMLAYDLKDNDFVNSL